MDDESRARTPPGRPDRCGLVWLNTWFLRDLRTPFGGAKLSGIGREGGRIRSIFIRTEERVREAMSNIEQAAGRLWTAQKIGVPCSPVRELLSVGDLKSAYAVQDINTRRSESEGAALLVGKSVLRRKRCSAS